MKRLIFTISILLCNLVFAVGKMDDCFLIHYGDPKAPLKVTEYFSFSCPHCVNLFQEFPKIRVDFIDKNLIYFTFHPVPREVTTLRAIMCLEKLSEKEKQVFLEGLFEYLQQNQEGDQKLCQVMQEFLGCLNKDKLPIDDLDYVKKSTVVQKAFLFVSQEESIQALPTAEINGIPFLKEVPSHAFFAQVVQEVLGEQK
jgi:Thioredoxin